MKICRFNNNRLGLVDLENGIVFDVTRALEVLGTQTYPLPGYDLLIKDLPKIKRAIRAELPGARRIPLHKVKLLAPVANPGKIIGAPINYTDHIDETAANAALAHGRDMASATIHKWGLFLKARSALVGPSHGITLRQPFTDMENRNDHEVELVAVIGKRGTHISQEDAMGYVAGYCIGLDMTLRGPQFAGFRKSIDTYAVLGPWMVTADEFGDPSDVQLALSVNGKQRQSASTRQLVYDIPKLIEFASSFYTLEPGDLIYTGTPAGVGPVKSGDTIDAEVDGIGTMSVQVR
jgi:2-keto-4-pentenoate hydratase/2-oxohepta-3-ene-1,7-dioic acid hydratase in catechol pathway